VISCVVSQEALLVFVSFYEFGCNAFKKHSQILGRARGNSYAQAEESAVVLWFYNRWNMKRGECKFTLN